MHPNRAECRRALGLENSAWNDAGAFSTTLSRLHEMDTRGGGSVVEYEACSRALLEVLLGESVGYVRDPKRRCEWALNILWIKEIPVDEPQFRLLRTHGHTWYFKTARGKGWKSADIRTPRGRLTIHDMLKPKVRTEKGRIVEIQDRGALRTRRASMLNVGKGAVETGDVQDVDRKLGVMDITNG